FTVVASDNVAAHLRARPDLQEKIKRGLNFSTEMAAAAYWTLLNFDSSWRINPDRAAKDKALTEVEIALLKYFQLEPGLRDAKTREAYLKTVDRIRSIYRLIDHGLTLGRSEIGIVNAGANTNARVALEQKKRNLQKDPAAERAAGRQMGNIWENRQVSP